MRRRSYEYYEVVTDLTGKDHSCHFRSDDLERAIKKLDEMTPNVDEQGNVYLVRCQLIEARKADKK